jgi:2,5-diketo-D-gluconate reductase A
MSPIQQVPTVDVRGVSVPQLGFGVFQVPPEDTEGAVATALETGYRHIDSAAAYRNEEGVGRAIRASGLPRDEVFVTTKVWNDNQGRDRALQAFERSLERLGFDYVDLYLIHWPVPKAGLYAETWQALLELQAAGRARAVGVSNFTGEHLSRVADATGVVPPINQVELHPYLQQPELRRFHAEHGIVTEAWSPLAQGAVLDDPVITGIAAAHERTPAQIVLRWHLQIGNVVIPKSVTPERIRENFELFDFELGDDELRAVEGLDRGERTGPDPNTMNLGAG